MAAENDIAQLFPLFLHGSAYATLKELTDNEKNDICLIYKALLRVFGNSKSLT